MLFFAVAYCPAQNTKENADFKLALNLFNDKLYDLSLEQFKQFISTYPSSPQSIESKYYIALAERALKKSDDARAAFQNFALTYPEHPRAPEAWWNIGEMFSEAKKFADAASAFERIKIFQPKSKLAPKALLMACDYFERAGDPENAKRCLRSLVSDYPADESVTPAHLRLGILLAKENNLIAARQELLQVTESGADKEMVAEASLQLAAVAELSGRSDEAEGLYHSIIDEKKADVSVGTMARARLQLARFCFSSGRQSEAVEYFQKLSSDSLKLPQDILQQSLLGLGNSYAATREFKKAADAYERSLLHPADSTLVVTAFFGAGRSYDELKEYRKSFAEFSAAADKSEAAPEKRYALLRAATLAVSLKNFETAVEYYKECLELFPNDDEAPEILFRIAEVERKQLNEPQKAIGLYASFLARYPMHEKCDDAQYAIGSSVRNTPGDRGSTECVRHPPECVSGKPARSRSARTKVFPPDLQIIRQRTNCEAAGAAHRRPHSGKGEIRARDEARRHLSQYSPGFSPGCASGTKKQKRSARTRLGRKRRPTNALWPCTGRPRSTHPPSRQRLQR